MSAVALLVLVGGSAAGAQGYGPPSTGPGEVTFTIDDSTVTPGQSVGVSGSGCPANTEVIFTIGETQVGSTTSDASGNYSGSVTIPNLPAGEYTINASCGAEVLGISITVGSGTGNTGGSSDDGLARTGLDLAPLAGIGAAALVLGAAAVYGSRRKQTS